MKNRPLRKLGNAEFVRKFATRQGGSDDAYLEGMLGTFNAVLGQIDHKGGVE